MHFCSFILLFKIKSFVWELGYVYISNTRLTISTKLVGTDEMNSEIMGLLTPPYFKNDDFMSVDDWPEIEEEVEWDVWEFIDIILDSDVHMKQIGSLVEKVP
jgi:hypothetical protein